MTLTEEPLFDCSGINSNIIFFFHILKFQLIAVSDNTALGPVVCSFHTTATQVKPFALKVPWCSLFNELCFFTYSSFIVNGSHIKSTSFKIQYNLICWDLSITICNRLIITTSNLNKALNTL